MKTTDSHHRFPRYPNLVKGMIINPLNQLWQADITYIRIVLVYPAAIVDACSRRLIGYAVSTRIHTTLTLKALRMAIPERKPGLGVIDHPNQGVRYVSREHMDELKNRGFDTGMERTGDSWVDARMESLFKTLKYDELHLCEYETLGDVMERPPYFVAEVYNQKRLHWALGYLAPSDFEELVIIQQSKSIPSQTLPTLSV